MNHHGNKQRKSGVTACTTVWQVRLQPPQWPLRWPSATGEGDGPLPKLVENPLSRGGHTHTHTHALEDGRWGHGGVGWGAKDVPCSVHRKMKPQTHTQTGRCAQVVGACQFFSLDVDAWKLGMVVADCLFIPKIVRCFRC